MIDLDDKYSEEAFAACYMVDCRKYLRPEAFLDMAQHIAMSGADKLDFGNDQLRACGGVWVVARQHVRFERPFLHKERGRIATWHKGIQGLFYLRDYLLLDADGEPAIRSTSSWVVMNIAERRVVRPESLAGIGSLGHQQSPDHAIEAPAAKVGLPREAEMTRIGSHRVHFSDVDYNHHANNVKYTVWAIDALPEELVYNSILKELTINFNREALPGETITLWHALDADGAHIVEGRVDDHQVFIERLLFQ